MNNRPLTLLGLLVLGVAACRSDSSQQSEAAVAAAPLPEVRYYEIADT